MIKLSFFCELSLKEHPFRDKTDSIMCHLNSGHCFAGAVTCTKMVVIADGSG